MRRRIAIVLLLMAVMSASCQRRPFAENTTKVNLSLDVHLDIIHNDEVPVPETMRVGLYHTETGAVRYTDYVGPEGGEIHPQPGEYDLIVYNIGTESTQVRGDDSHGDIEAFTSEVSSFLKAQLSKFLAKRAKAKAEAERARTEAGSGTKGSDPETSAPSDEERIVYEPDHLFVGRIRSVDIPALLEGEDDREVMVEVDAHSIVETWKISLTNVEGLEWVQSVAAIISGQSGSHFIGREEDSEDAVSIYFEMKADKENGTIYGQFNTFGKHPQVQSDLSLDINLTDTGGDEHHYHFDVDSEFMDNPGFHIEIEEEVKVEEPKGGGGGFAPTVDDWEEIKTEINI